MIYVIYTLDYWHLIELVAIHSRIKIACPDTDLNFTITRNQSDVNINEIVELV